MDTSPKLDNHIPALDVRNISAGYDNKLVLKDVSFRVTKGDIVGIIGPNGAGKSTLFKTILNLIRPWKGNTLIFGRSNHSQRRMIGYMPQIEVVDWDFPISVRDMVLTGRYANIGLFKTASKHDHKAVSEALDLVSVSHLEGNLIRELSGGQRRRVLLARALTNHPEILLLDEPMAGLDATLQHQFISVLKALRDSGTTVIFNSHDLSCVSAACDLTLCLNSEVLAYGPPKDVLVEDILGKTFGTHLLMVHIDGQAYAYQHHKHSGNDLDEVK